VIEDVEQAPPAGTVAHRLGDLERLPRRTVEHEVGALADPLDPGDVREAGLLGL